MNLHSLTKTLPVVALFALAGSLSAEEYRLETASGTLPREELPAAIAEQLQGDSIKVVRGESRTMFEIWLCKNWPTTESTLPNVIYPLAQGQLVGVVRLTRSGRDFRDQKIPKGLYTLRYAWQPVDGAHVGTSPTRDFLLLVSTEKDQKLAAAPPEDLAVQSSESIETAHPAMLALQRPPEGAADNTVLHDEQHDWWMVRLTGQGRSAAGTSPLELFVVVAGHAEE